jgi:Domain of unknown function (DUF1707)
MSAIEPASRQPIRVGDEARDRVADLLSDHLAAGTISQDEFADRVGLVLAARTTSELGRAVADLPLTTHLTPRSPSDPEGPGTHREIAVAAASTGWVIGGLLASGGAAFAAVMAIGYEHATLAFFLVFVAAVVGVAAGFRAGRSPH